MASPWYCNLIHPPSSPDLNPIEPLWLIIKNCVADIPGSSNYLNALWAAVQKVWDGITEEEIKKYTGRMADRVLAVKEAEGWHTHF
jgi:transposase